MRMTYKDNQVIHGRHWAGNGAAIEILNVGEELLAEEVSTVKIQ
jgi:hypothetical protein